MERLSFRIRHGWERGLTPLIRTKFIKTQLLQFSQRAYTVYTSYERIKHKNRIEAGWLVVEAPKREEFREASKVQASDPDV